ncbi:hypothetical protein CIPAW_08G145500 [Carya illinoinensis]|uniref:Uncharacterized protein n=1 Tax=Carya illinoinensis TaxID=32201 RepID=A0A8T1PRR2_CARIL|nr:hypothetical protein CIPAW_08G145500 [Carya illinoinensis]
MVGGCSWCLIQPRKKTVHVQPFILGLIQQELARRANKGSLFVSFCKKQADTIFKGNRNLSILSESGEKQVAFFQCEPTGELLFQLKSHSTSNLPLKRTPKVLGSTSLFLQDFLAPVSELSVEKWLELVPSSSSVISKPIGLRVAVSFTVPSPAPHVLRMVCSQRFPKSSCFFPLPGKVRHAKSMVHVIDETGAELLSLQMRDLRKDKAKENCILSKEVIGIMASGERRTLADFVGTGWFLMDSHWSLHFRKNSGHDGHLFELSGNRMVKFFPGRKLGYEPNRCVKHRSEKDFMTAVDFSMEDPYGKEVALLDLKSGIFNVKEEWMVVPGITAAFILADVFKKGGYDGFAVNCKNMEMESLAEEANVDINAAISENGNLSGGGCGGKCGSSCGNALKIFENDNLSGGKCGSSCGNAFKSGGCGGSGCRNMVKSSGCGNMVMSGGCGGCGGSFENISKSGGGCGTKSDHSCAEEHSKEATF